MVNVLLHIDSLQSVLLNGHSFTTSVFLLKELQSDDSVIRFRRTLTSFDGKKMKIMFQQTTAIGTLRRLESKLPFSEIINRESSFALLNMAIVCMCPNWLSLMKASKVRQGGVAEVSMSTLGFRH